MALLKGVRRRIAAAACMAVSLVVCAAPAAQTPAEDEVRAAFLYNFTKFVEWPSPPGQKSAEPFRMCVVADADFTRVVDAIIRGETVLGRPLVLATPATPEVARTCQMLYVAQGERERGTRLVAAVRDLPVLTVSDAPRFLASGGAIQFVLDNRRVRFDINLAAAERARLRVSSNLLRVARNITPNRTRE
jgi:hypothetical protein